MTSITYLNPRRQPVAESSAAAPADRILRMPTVSDRVGLSPATIYRRIARREFPAQVSLGGKSIGFRESQINAWIASRGQAGAA